MLKKISFVILMLIYLISPFGTLEVHATQSRINNFNKSYTLTDDPIQNIIAVAKKQVGKTGNELGYSEDWCADFVSDCAILAGVASAIPAHGGVRSLYNNVKNAGGYDVSSPQAGDLVIYDWDDVSGNFDHVEIVYEVSGTTVKCYGGNTGKTGSLYTNYVKVRTINDINNYSQLQCFVRPKYEGIVPPDCILPNPWFYCGTPAGEYSTSSSVSAQVRWLQQALNVVQNAGLTVDGDFGSNTNAAVKTFQSNHGLSVDGIAGANTIAALVTELNIRGYASDGTLDMTPDDLGAEFDGYIMHSKGWKPVTVNDTNKTVLKSEITAGGDATQIFHFVRINTNPYTYKIISYKNNYALDVTDASDTDGAIIQTYPWHDHDAQKWCFYQNADGSYFVRPLSSSTMKVLDATGGYTDDGTQMELYRYYMYKNNAQRYNIWKMPGVATPNVSVNNSTGEVTISWSATNWTDKYDVEIYKGTTQVKSISGLSSTSTKTTLDPGTYSVKVISINSAGWNSNRGFNTVSKSFTVASGITLNKTAVTLNIGNTVTLSATVTPSGASNKTVTWSSSNSSVAAVSNSGVVTAKAAGTAIITAKNAYGNSDVCNVNVNGNPLKGISLNTTSSTLDAGGTLQLSVTYTPSDTTDAKTVTWSSSNTSVATVSSSGLVTAKAAGTAAITATATANTSLKATCTITVKPVSVTGVSLNHTTLSLTKGTSDTLTATVSPSNATNKTVTWSSSNTSVATVNNGTVTAVSGGTAEITVTTADGNKQATCKVTVTVPAEAVRLNKTELVLSTGDTDTLIATVTPSDATDKTVSWSSDNTTVASVSGGKVTAVSAGTAIITVSTSNGKTAACTVTVNEPSGITDEWLSSFVYHTTDNGTVVLDNLVSENIPTALTVYNKAVVDGKTYSTGLKNTSFQKTDSSANTVTESIVFADTILFPANCTEMFKNYSALETIDLSKANTSNVTSMSGMFYKCSSLTALDLSGFDTSKVTNMHWMFNYCGSLTSLNLNSFNTSNVTNMSGMFENCSSLKTIDLSSFNTSKVLYFNTMFSGCSSLMSLDVSGFDTASATGMNTMFRNCSALTELDVSGFETGKVTQMSDMFSGCSGLTSLDVSGFDTSKVTFISMMFYGCSGLEMLDLSSFDLSKVTSISSMLTGCRGLTELYAPAEYGTASIELPKTMYYKDNGAILSTRVADSGIGSKTYLVSVQSMLDGGTETIPAAGISLNRTTLSLTKGTAETLTATISPADTTDKTVTWTSSNTSVATVSDGTVTALNRGTAVITASTSNGLTAECSVEVLDDNINIYGSSLTLEGKIGINFYLEIDEDGVNDLTVVMRANDEEIRVPASEGIEKTIDGKTYRMYAYPVAAKQMRDIVTLTVEDDNGNKVKLLKADTDYTDGYPYSANDYFIRAEEVGSDKTKALTRVLNNYGKYTQIYFNYNVTDEVLDTVDVGEVTAATLEPYKEVRSETELEGLSYVGGSTMLDDAIGYRVYFNLASGHSIGEYTFKINGKEVTPIKSSGTQYYVEKAGIAAKDLGEMDTITVRNGTQIQMIEYSALSYAYKALTLTGDNRIALQNMCRAMYLYNQQAIEYFNTK